MKNTLSIIEAPRSFVDLALDEIVTLEQQKKDLEVRMAPLVAALDCITEQLRGLHAFLHPEDRKINATCLRDAIIHVLRASPQGLSAPAIVGILRTKSTAAYTSSAITQCLFRNTEQFVRVTRGIYVLRDMRDAHREE